MPAPLRRCLLALAVALLACGQWNVLQGVAWAGMLLSRSLQTDVATAVATTFDGEHPCALCAAVADGKKKADDEPGRRDLRDVAKAAKHLAPCPLALPLAASAMPAASPAAADRHPDGRRDQPPVPPPLAG